MPAIIPQTEERPAPRVAVAIYANEKQPSPKRHGLVSWERFEPRLLNHDIRAEKSGLAFGPYSLIHGGTRRNSDVEALSMLVTDSDNGVSLDDLGVRFTGLQAAIYTTHSHSPAKTKARVVAPLLRPVPVKDWRAFLEGAKAHFGIDIFDPATKDAARLYYFPSCPPEMAEHRRSMRLEGAFLDPQPFIERGREILAPSTPTGAPTHLASVAISNEWSTGRTALREPGTPENVERLRSAAAAIPAATAKGCTRDIYLTVLWGFAATGWNCAEELAREWCMTSPEDFDEDDFGKDWRSYDAERAERVGVGSLFKLAEQNGWIDPRHAVNSTKQPTPDIAQTLNDTSNAERFVRACGERLRYVVELRIWLIWHEGHWRYDRKGQIVELAKRVATRMFSDAGELATAADRNALFKWANASLQLPRLEAMVKLAQASLAVSVSELDADPWLLGVRNGVVELRTGTFRQSRPEDLITKIANVEYVAGATCPTWEAMLDGCMGGNRQLADFIQRAAGYTLTGSTSEQVFFFAYGVGANGKSTVINALREIMGGHGLQSQPEVIMAQRNTNPSGPTPELARLAGVRMVAMVETEDGQRLHESRVKQMSGGDAMTARVLHGEPFDFVPKFKLWLAGNHRPVIRGDDHGIWRRIVLIPFLVTIPPEKRDRMLAEKLRDEYPGVLNWLIRGCLEWQRVGLDLPSDVVREVDQYKSDMDLIAQWLDEQCSVGPAMRCRARSAYQDYSTWAKDGGHQVITEVRFAQKLDERGFTKRKERQGMIYLGLTPRQGSLV